MIKRAKRVNLTQDMIDDIWLYWNRLGESSRTAAFNRIASIVGCSHATVYRVVSACEEAASGKVVKYDKLKYPNHMMAEYINQKFAQPESVQFNESKSEISDIRMLAESINHLAEAITERNVFMRECMRNLKSVFTDK